MGKREADQGVKEVLTSLQKTKIVTARVNQPCANTRLILLVLGLVSAFAVLLSQVFGSEVGLAISIFSLVSVFVIYSGVSFVVTVRSLRENPLNVIERRLGSESAAIELIMKESPSARGMVRLRIEAQIDTFQKRSAGTAVFPKILVAFGVAAVALQSSSIFQKEFADILPFVTSAGNVGAPLMAMFGLAFYLSDLLGNFELARLRDYLYLLDAADLMKKLSVEPDPPEGR